MLVCDWRLKAVTVAMLINCGLAASGAHAGYVVTVMQQASGVLAKGSGEIDLNGLTVQVTAPIPPVMSPDAAVIVTGPVIGAVIDGYSVVTGPTSFGTGDLAGPTFGLGDLVGISGSVNLLFVPQGYVSDSFLSSLSFYGSNATLKDLGVTPGTYEWTWGTGANQNFTLKVEAAAVSDSTTGLPAFAIVLALLFAAKLRELRRSPSPAFPES